MLDCANSSKYPVQLQISYAKTVLKNNVIYRHIKCLALGPSVALTLPDLDGGHRVLRRMSLIHSCQQTALEAFSKGGF